MRIQKLLDLPPAMRNDDEKSIDLAGPLWTLILFIVVVGREFPSVTGRRPPLFTVADEEGADEEGGGEGVAVHDVHNRDACVALEPHRLAIVLVYALLALAGLRADTVNVARAPAIGEALRDALPTLPATGAISTACLFAAVLAHVKGGVKRARKNLKEARSELSAGMGRSMPLLARVVSVPPPRGRGAGARGFKLSDEDAAAAQDGGPWR
jgi:hypothetical protein